MRFDEINDPVRVRGLELAAKLCENYPTRLKLSPDASTFFLVVYGSSTNEDLSSFITNHNLKVVRRVPGLDLIILTPRS